MKAQKIFNPFLLIVLCLGMLTTSQRAGAAPIPEEGASAKDAPIAGNSQPLTGNPAPQAAGSGTFGAFELNRAEFSAFGEFPFDGFGYFALSYIGDINNDGRDDFAVGAFIYDGTKTFGNPDWGTDHGCGGYDPGALYIVLGKAGGFERNKPIREVADLILVGNSADWFGRTFTIADMDADGKNDLVVSGGGNIQTYPASLAHGSAYVIKGRSPSDWNNWISTTPSISGPSCYNPTGAANQVKSIDDVAYASMLGTNPEDRMGWTQMGNADVNGDGHLDLLVSAYLADTGTGINPYTTTGNGIVYVVLADGTPGKWTMNMPIATTANAIIKGNTIPGEWNDYDDAPDAGWIPVGLSENLGGWLTGVGDVTGDGKDDFVTSGAWRHMLGLYGQGTDAVRGFVDAYLISGASIPTLSVLNETVDKVAITRFTVTPYASYVKVNTIGWTSGKLGDINNDGISDFAIADPWAVDYRGTVHVFYGRDSSNPWPATMNLSERVGDKCGWYPSPNAPDKPDVLLESWTQYSEFGGTVASVGDVNGDGEDDFVATAGGPEIRWGADVPDDPASGYWYSRNDAYLFFGNSGLLNPCDYVVQSERYAIGIFQLSDFIPWRDDYRHFKAEETGAIGTDPRMDRGASLGWVSTLPGDFNGDGKGDILMGDVSSSSREECAGIDMTNDPESAQCGLGKVYVLLGKSALSDTAVPELWMRDTSLRDDPTKEDIGNEPNLESDVVNASPDLWVRLANDKLREHQPITSAGQNVFVNARITNSGSEWDVNSTQPNDFEILWTCGTDFNWPADFTAPNGGQVGAITVPQVGPGDRKVFSLPWTVPTNLPAGCAPENISFLARFTSDVVETSDGWANVRNNRRIVARAGEPLIPTCVTPPSNMIAWWPLDETTGSTATERIAGNTGWYVNTPSQVSGKVAGALEFDGVGDFVYVPHPSNGSLDLGANDITIDSWVKILPPSIPPLVAREEILVEKLGTANTGFSLNIVRDTMGIGYEYVFRLADGSGSGSTLHNSGMMIPYDGQWHLVAVTVDRDQITGGKFYVDGQEIGSFNPTNQQGSVNNQMPLQLSDSASSVALDEVEIFNKALTSSEINSIYGAGSYGKCKISNTDPGDYTTDLKIEKTAESSELKHGENSYQIRVTNLGNQVAPGIVVKDLLPAGMFLKPDPYVDGDWQCTGNPVWQFDAKIYRQLVTCVYSGVPLHPIDFTQFRLPVYLLYKLNFNKDLGGWDGETVTNCARLSGSLMDPGFVDTNLENDEGCTSTIALESFIISGNTDIDDAFLFYNDNGIQSIASDANGDYFFEVPSGWSGTVTVSKTGYTFSPVDREYSNVTADKTNENYTATRDEYVLTINSAHGTVTKSPNQPTYHYGDVVTLGVTPDAGWTFISWTPALVGNQVTINGNTTVTADYTQDTYTLTVNSAHGTVTKSPDQATYHYGDVVTLSVTPETGWTFTGWTPSLTDNQVTITGNTTITANYTQNEYTLTVNSAHGTVTKSPDQPTYHYGDVVTLSVTPEAGWTFTGWTPSLTDNQVTITGNTTVTANYREIPVITWTNPANITYGTALSGTQLNATASTPGTFAYTPASGTVLNIGTHTLHVDFVPADTVNFTNASKDVSITVTKAAPVITWSNPANIVYGTALSGTQLNASASTPGTFTYNPVSGTVLNAGTHTLHVDFVPTDTVNYANASKDVSITVTKAAPVITWANPADIDQGTPLSETQLNATANVPGEFTYAPAAGATLSTGTHTLHVDFTPTDTVNYANASADVSLTVLDHAIFADVPDDYWARPFIEKLYLNQITGGCGGGNYCPNTNVNRAMMAVFVLRAAHGLDFSPPPASGAVFTDVPTDGFAAAWIEQLAAEGITGGCGGGKYCPNNPVTRAQMAVFLVKALYGTDYVPPAATGTVFTDVPADGFAAAFIEQLVADGITGGCGGGNFCPNKYIIRAEMAVFLVAAFNLP